jgi:hypothetical protein
MEAKYPSSLTTRPVSEDSATLPSGPAARFHRPMKPLKPRQAAEVPNRYLVKEDESGRYLSCLEAPELKVRINRKMAVTGGAARKADEGTIFLDGAAQSAPFLDLERRVYNLDHHEGCVRPFTLATCEQALVLMVRGLDMREKPWVVFANEPDLDALIAIWVLLNSMHLQADLSAIREAVIPLVRLEGVIDSHGLEMAGLTGFPSEMLEETRGRLGRLRETELALKDSGEWEEMDPLDYVCSQLQVLDRMIYPADYFEAFRGIEELAKVELIDSRIAVVCRCDCGIYEVEQELKRLYGRRLGVIALEKGPGVYTLRQVDPFLPVNLEAAYKKLNVLDPAVEGGGSADRWGGSGDIGGSPRKSGTELSPADIADALRLAYRRPTFLDRLRSVLLSIGTTAVPMVGGWLMVLLMADRDAGPGRLLEEQALVFLATALALTLVVLLIVGRRGRYRLYGFQWPEGYRWMLVIPAVLAGAVAGGVWLLWPVSLAGILPGPAGVASWVALLGFPLLAEVLFRGVAHGLMVENFSVQHSDGRWFVSWPVAISALLYAIWTLPLLPLTLASHLWPLAAFVSVPLGAMVCGVGLGIARERSGGILVPLAIHYVAVLAVAIAGLWLR